ncbi:MAG: SOS response-associated peptidase [Anaerolineae bacterium]|jgi:putative SOS response-associated peptidase YedK
MCGRFTLSDPDAELAVQFNLPEIPDLKPRYNIAPTQPVATVRAAAGGPAREMVLLHWGLIPFWAKDPGIGSRMINARSETVAEKPAFRAAFRRRRCLVVADGFYEWQKQNGNKQPYYIHLRDGQPFAFAGLWEHWEGEAGVIESCTLLTTEPNELVRPVHNRMPVIVKPDDYELWLDPEMQQPERLQPLLGPYPSAEMDAYPVSRRVNRPQNDDPQCIEPLPQQQGFEAL